MIPLNPTGPLTVFHPATLNHDGNIDTDSSLWDMCLLSPEAAVLILDRHLPSSFDPLFGFRKEGLFSFLIVNPTTGETVHSVTIPDPTTAPADRFLRIGSNGGAFRRLDEQTAVWYIALDVSYRVGDVGFVNNYTAWGTIKTDGTFTVNLVPTDDTADPHVHDQDTSNVFWLDPVTKQLTFSYWTEYYYPTRGVIMWSRTIDLTTNQLGPRVRVYAGSWDNGYPFPLLATETYYGTIAFGGGKALGTRISDEPFRVFPHELTMDNRPSNPTILQKLPRADYNLDWFWYQVGGATDIAMGIFSIYDRAANRSEAYTQLWAGIPNDPHPVAPPTLLNEVYTSRDDASDGLHLADMPYDIMNQFPTRDVRLLTGLFYDNNVNFGDRLPPKLALGVQDVHNGDISAGYMYPLGTGPQPDGVGNGRAYVFGDMLPNGDAVYAFHYDDNFQMPGIPFGYRTLYGFQLWHANVIEPPVRINQRDDGLASSGGPRLPHLGARSAQGSNPPRVGSANTYH